MYNGSFRGMVTAYWNRIHRKERMKTLMKKHTAKLIVLTLLFMTVGTAAALRAQETPQPRFRVGVYFQGSWLNDDNLTDFFKHSQRNMFGLEGSVHVMYNIDVWASYRRYTDETTTTYHGHLDKFRLNQTSLGVVYRPIVWKVLEPFVGAGLEIYSYSEKIAEEDVDLPDTSGNAVGFHLQGGTYINIYKFKVADFPLQLVGKVFVRQNFVKDTLANALPDGSTELDLGGTEFGAGLGVKF